MPILYLFDATTGQGLYGPDQRRSFPPELLAAILAGHPGAVAHQMEEDLGPATGLMATLAEGAVTAVAAIIEPTVWLHHSLSGGDGATVPGIPLDGSQALSVSVELRLGQDAASDLIPETPAVAGPWRITLRDQAGAVYDVVRATVDSQGRGDFAYTPPTGGRAARCHLSQADLTTVTIGGQEYKVRLANPAVPEVGHFVVYRPATPAA